MTSCESNRSKNGGAVAPPPPPPPPVITEGGWRCDDVRPISSCLVALREPLPARSACTERPVDCVCALCGPRPMYIPRLAAECEIEYTYTYTYTYK